MSSHDWSPPTPRKQPDQTSRTSYSRESSNLPSRLSRTHDESPHSYLPRGQESLVMNSQFQSSYHPETNCFPAQLSSTEPESSVRPQRQSYNHPSQPLEINPELSRKLSGNQPYVQTFLYHHPSHYHDLPQHSRMHPNISNVYQGAVSQPQQCPFPNPKVPREALMNSRPSSSFMRGYDCCDRLISPSQNSPYYHSQSQPDGDKKINTLLTYSKQETATNQPCTSTAVSSDSQSLNDSVKSVNTQPMVLKTEAKNSMCSQNFNDQSLDIPKNVSKKRNFDNVENVPLSYKCPICKESNQSKLDAEHHMKLLHPNCKKQIVYEYCIGKNTKIIRNVNCCPECKEVYFTRDQMLNHMLHKHLDVFLHAKKTNYKIFKIYNHNVKKFSTVYLCHKCPLNIKLNFFTTKESYETHIDIKHEFIVDDFPIEQGTELYINNIFKTTLNSNTFMTALEILEPECFPIFNDVIYTCNSCKYVFNEINKLECHKCAKVKIDVQSIYSAGRIVPPDIKNETFYHCPMNYCEFNSLDIDKIEQHFKNNHEFEIKYANVNIPSNNIVLYHCKICNDNEKKKYYFNEISYEKHFNLVHINFKRNFNIARCKMITKSFEIMQSELFVSQNIKPPLIKNSSIMVKKYHCKLCKYKSFKLKNIQDHIKGKHSLSTLEDVMDNVIVIEIECYICQVCVEKKGKLEQFDGIDGYVSHYKLLHDITNEDLSTDESVEDSD